MSTDTAPQAPGAAHDTAEGGTHHAHPTELQYIKIACILALITGAEVAIYYIKALEGVLVPLLILFSLVKFSMVVMWFMHLRFDNRLFRRLFVTGVCLALFVFTAVLTTFHVWTR